MIRVTLPPFTPHAGQRRLIAQAAKRNVACCGRRWGKRGGTRVFVSDDPSGALAASIGAHMAAMLTAALGRGPLDVPRCMAWMLARRNEEICARHLYGETLAELALRFTDAGSGGSYSAAKVADVVRNDRRNADLRLVSATVQRLVDALWQFNARAGAPPRFVMADDTGLERARAERG